MGESPDHVDMRVPDFLAFLERRPEEERWELVAGMPIMMTPPKIAHQRIASNLERALNDALEAIGLPRRVDREIGLEIAGAPGYRPEPELAVIDIEHEHERYASRFYGIVEVLSETDAARNPRTGRRAIEDKLGFYRSHPHVEFVLLVSQEEMRIEVQVRASDGSWHVGMVLDDGKADLVLPGLGRVCRVADAYRGVRHLA